MTDAMGQTRRATRRAGSLALLGLGVRTGSQVMSLVLLLLAGRFLTIEMFGVFALAVILLNLAQQILYAGVYNFILKHAAVEPMLATAFTLQWLIAGGFSAVMLAAGGLAFGLVPGSQLGPLILATAPLPLVNVVACWQEAMVLRGGKVAPYYLSLLVTEVTAFLVGAGLLLAGAGVWSLLLSRYAGGVLLALSLSLVAPRLPKPGYDRGHAGEIMGYSLGLYGSSGLSFFTAYGADVLIGAVLNTRAVGLFRMGARTATAAYDVFAQTTRVLGWQMIGRMAREGRMRDPLWLHIAAVVFMVMFAALGSMAVLAQPLVMSVLGATWLPMVPVLQVVAMVRVPASFDLIATAHFTAAGETGFLLRMRIAEALILAASVAGAVWFGPVAVACALLPPALFLNASFLRRIARQTGTGAALVAREFAVAALIALGAIVPAAGVAHIMADRTPALTLVVATLAGLAGFGVMALMVFGSWTRRQIGVLSQAMLHESQVHRPEPAPDPALP